MEVINAILGLEVNEEGVIFVPVKVKDWLCLLAVNLHSLSYDAFFVVVSDDKRRIIVVTLVRILFRQ